MKERQETSNGVRVIYLDDGRKKYEARFKRQGAGESSRRFSTKAEALAWKRSMDGAVDQGVPLPTKSKSSSVSTDQLRVAAGSRNDVMVSDVVKTYITFRANSPKPLSDNARTEYERVEQDFQGIPLHDLRYEDVVHYLRVLLDEPIKRHAQRRDDGLPYKKYAEATVRKFYFALKRSVESYSRTHRIPIDTTLFVMEKGFVPSAWAGRRDRRLAEGEEHQLYAAGLQRGDFTYTTEDWKHIIGFALETAMRQQEITLAKWKDVFSAGEKLKIPKENSKTQQERVVLLSIKARSILAAQKATCPKGESRIFHQTPDADAVCEAFARLTNRAKIEDLHFHDLRHEATSRLCESGQLQQMAIMEMTGHKTMLAFRGYVHLLNHEKSVRLD